MLSAFAVLRLMTNSNLVVCWTGRSAGVSPLRTLDVEKGIGREHQDRSGSLRDVRKGGLDLALPA